MLDPELLAILCCPETRQDLREASASEVTALNARIAAGAVRNRAGQPLSQLIDGLLIRADGHCAYVVRDGIPAMLVEEAIPLETA